MRNFAGLLKPVVCTKKQVTRPELLWGKGVRDEVLQMWTAGDILPREDKGDREGIPHTHPIP